MVSLATVGVAGAMVAAAADAASSAARAGDETDQVNAIARAIAKTANRFGIRENRDMGASRSRTETSGGRG
jgi:hypothetical protein